MEEAWNSLTEFFDSVWALIEVLVWTLVETFRSVLDFVLFPIQLVSYLPSVVATGVTIGVAIMVIKAIGGRS